MKNRCKSEFCLRKYLIGVLIAVTISVALAGCRNKKMTPKRATEFATDRLNLSEEQSQKIAPIAEDLFAERESLQEIQKAVNDEILAQMKNKTADADKLKAVLIESLDQLRAKLPKFVGSFEKFHVALTLEQRAEIVEKMERRRKRTEKGGWGWQRGGFWH